MMRARTVQIVVLSIIWALVLISYDRLFSKRLFAPTREQVAALATPTTRVRIEHVACGGGAEEVKRAIKDIPWLVDPDFEMEPKRRGAGEAAGPARAALCGLTVFAKVKEAEKADFMALTEGLRRLGVSPAELEFGGIPHFALRAEVSLHIQCPSCEQAARNAMIPRIDPKTGGTFKWLDSVRVNREARTITAYVKYNHWAHVGEMARALGRAGFPPSSIRILIGK